jgi:sugar transferase (PEP-CTERM system associated)
MPTIRIFRHYIPTPFFVLGAVELILFLIAFYIGVEIRFWGSPPSTFEALQPLFPKAVVYAMVLLLGMIAMGLYERRSHLGKKSIVLRTAAAFLLSLVPLSVAYYIAPVLFLGRGALGYAHLIAYFVSVLLRVFFFRFAGQDVLKRRILVLGAGAKAARILNMKTIKSLGGSLIVGFVRMPGDASTIGDIRVITDNRPLSALVNDLHIDEVVLATDDRRMGLPTHDILDCKMSGVDVVDLLTFFERETGQIRLAILDPSWLFLSDGFRQGVLRAYLKRVFDICASLLLLPIALPVMVCVTVLVLAENGWRGPILFSQIRTGEDERPFRIYKFRSMQVGAEQDGVARWASANDARITRVGALLRKFRLDELPQLFNVLLGDMSFVGPRPERPEFVRKLNEIPYYRERHRVKPGLTGWAQINYQYAATEEDTYNKLQYDLYYVKNYSLFIDLLILIKTVEVILLGKGAH